MRFKELLYEVLRTEEERRKHPRKSGDVWKHKDPIHGGRRPKPATTQ